MFYIFTFCPKGLRLLSCHSLDVLLLPIFHPAFQVSAAASLALCPVSAQPVPVSPSTSSILDSSLFTLFLISLYSFTRFCFFFLLGFWISLDFLDWLTLTVFPPYFFALSHPSFLPESPAKLPCLFLSIILPTYLSIPVFPLFPYFFSPISLLLFLFPQEYIYLIAEGSKKHLSDVKSIFLGLVKCFLQRVEIPELLKEKDLLTCAVKSACLWFYFQKNICVALVEIPKITFRMKLHF